DRGRDWTRRLRRSQPRDALESRGSRPDPRRYAGERLRPDRLRHCHRLHQLSLLAGVQRRGLGDLDWRRADDRRLPVTKNSRRLIAEAAAPRLDRFLAERAPDLSRSAAARLIKGHLALLNGDRKSVV